mmetsp:Transcript_10984/g.25984  ORF Transcript_10984/g.25984 Transcript_10984/m.25984 type:complete len:98 (+) Transcript_10984:30-323(+)
MSYDNLQGLQTQAHDASARMLKKSTIGKCSCCAIAALEPVHRYEFDGKLSGDGNHEHDSEDRWPDGIVVRSGKPVSKHVATSHELVHRIDKKGDGNG